MGKPERRRPSRTVRARACACVRVRVCMRMCMGAAPLGGPRRPPSRPGRADLRDTCGMKASPP